MKELTVIMELDEWQLKKLDEFAALRRKSEIVPRPENCYRHEATLQYILRMVSFDAMLEEATALEKERSGCRKEAVSEFWGGELSEDGEAEPDEPDADGEEEELVHITFSITEGNMIHDALFDAGQRVLARRFPHTWTYPVEDESLFNAVWEGDTPMTLTEEECETIVNALFMRACSRAEAGYTTISNELFDLARRISGDDAREEEPETLISVRDASGVVRMVTLDEMEEMREAAQGIYAGEPPEPQDEPEEPDEPDADEALDELWEDSEIVSNAEEKPSPLIKDNSDGYFYYLEHGHWPPDDEVLAGAGVPCTGDYGLSDCLVVTQSTLDFVDAFFT